MSMIMMDKKRYLTQVIKNHIPSHSEGGAVESQKEDMPPEYHQMANDLISAVHEKDTGGAAQALKAFVMACNGGVIKSGE